MKEKILAKTLETVAQMGFACLEARISRSPGGMALKVVIHKPGGDVSTDDTAETANILQKLLEVEFPGFSTDYDVLVESPGVDRKLNLPDELKYFSDRELRFVLRKTEKYGLKDNVVVGHAVLGPDGHIEVAVSGGGKLALDIEDISSARIYFDIRKYL